MLKNAYVRNLLIGVSAVSLASPALGREAEQSAQVPVEEPGVGDAADETGETTSSGDNIVVTGTRIVRDGYTAPTPVTVAPADELIRSTPSSIPDGLNKLPQFQNSLSGSKAASNFSNLPIHGNILNLRGLGTTGANPKGPLRTLILFDGIRVPPTEYIGTVDTNVIPQLLIQRVDVVTGGASAAWGSDAVAGVVNFILNKKFTGISGVAQAGVSDRGDTENQRIGAAGGFRFADGRGHLLLSAEYFNNEGLRRNERKNGANNYVFVGANPGTGAGGANLQPGSQGNPFIILPDVRISAIAPSGRITGSSVAGNPFVGLVVNPDGSTRPFNPGTRVGTTGFQQGGDGFFISARGTAIIPVTNYQTFGRLSYDVVPDVNVYVQGIFARSDFTYPTQTNSLIGPSNAVTLFSGNPFLTPQMQATLTKPGSSITFQQQDAGQAQPIADERTDFWMVTSGLEGKLGAFNWEVNYTHGQSEHEMDTSGLYDIRRLNAAVDVVLVNGVPTCRVLTDPTTAAAFAGCAPLNVLRGDPSRTKPEGYAYATGTSSYDATIKHDSVMASFSGSLFNLPAGPVDFAVGAEYRKQTLRLTSNADPALLDTPAERNAYFAGLRGVPSSALFFWLTNVGSANGSDEVKEVFGEVAVPLLKDRPFFNELSLNGAVRVTDYSTSGTVTTYKVGAVWSPVEDLLLRSTYSRDIRAPNLFELFAGAQSAIGIVNDSVVRDASGNIIAGSGQNVNVSSSVSGNPNLDPEIAKTLTIGAVFRPTFLRGFSASIDFYSIKLGGAIDQLSAQQILTNCNNNLATAPECALIERTSPTTFPTLIRVQPANLAFLKTRGIDFDASYRTAIGDGALGVRLYANYLDQFDTKQFTGAPTLHYAGVSVVSSNPAAYPRWRGNLTVDYTNGPFGITVSEQYISKMRFDIPGSLPNGARSSFNDRGVGSVFYTDLTLRAEIKARGGTFEPFLTINNLFDKDPPLVPGTIPGVNFPTNLAAYDIVGRTYTAGVRFKF